MNREFKTTSKLIRSLCAGLALVFTASVALFIDGLAHHYAVEGTQTAQVQRLVVASR